MRYADLPQEYKEVCRKRYYNYVHEWGSEDLFKNHDEDSIGIPHIMPGDFLDDLPDSEQYFWERTFAASKESQLPEIPDVIRNELGLYKNPNLQE